ncbi:MAG: 4Fe-4S binding protein [Candidatus Aminicenantales bacterium]
MRKKKMSSERRKNLRALIQWMNKRNKPPLPITKELVDCFEAAVTPEENAFLLKLGLRPHTYEELASLSGLPGEQFEPFFETLLHKGFVWPTGENGEAERYLLNSILVGWFEIFLSDGSDAPEKQEFAKRVDRLFNSWRKLNFFPVRNILNYRNQRMSKAGRRIVAALPPVKEKNIVEIDVNRKIETTGPRVYPSQTILDLIERFSGNRDIALMHCFCRHWKKLVDEPCRFGHAAESCIVIGTFARSIDKYGIGHLVTKEKALEIINNAQEKGAVHQVFHEGESLDQPEIAICNCCWDCCGVLGSYNRGILPLRFKAYYHALIPDPSLCSGCGECAKYCPVRAIQVIDEKGRINPEMCIGCGQCRLKCPHGAVELEPQEREVILPLLKKSQARIPV